MADPMDIRDSINDRLKSAILGTYTIYLMAWNWRMFIFAFSDLSAKEKIDAIEFLLDHSSIATFLGPLIMTLVTVFGVQYLKNQYEMWQAKEYAKVVKYRDQLARSRSILNTNSETTINQIVQIPKVLVRIEMSLSNISASIDHFNNMNLVDSKNFKSFIESVINQSKEIYTYTQQAGALVKGFKSEISGMKYDKE